MLKNNKRVVEILKFINNKGQGLVEFALVCAFCVGIGLAARDAGLIDALSDSYSGSQQDAFASSDIQPYKTQVAGNISAGTNVGGGCSSACVSETPGTETPGTETPGTETPGTETPGTETPGTETPGTETPGSETPGGTGIVVPPAITVPEPVSIVDTIDKIQDAYSKVSGTDSWNKCVNLADILIAQWSSLTANDTDPLRSVINTVKTETGAESVRSGNVNDYWKMQLLYKCANWAPEAEDLEIATMLVNKMKPYVDAYLPEYKASHPEKTDAEALDSAAWYAAQQVADADGQLKAAITSDAGNDNGTVRYYLLQSVYKAPTDVSQWNVGLAYWRIKQYDWRNSITAQADSGSGSENTIAQQSSITSSQDAADKIIAAYNIVAATYPEGTQFDTIKAAVVTSLQEKGWTDLGDGGIIYQLLQNPESWKEQFWIAWPLKENTGLKIEEDEAKIRNYLTAVVEAYGNNDGTVADLNGSDPYFKNMGESAIKSMIDNLSSNTLENYNVYQNYWNFERKFWAQQQEVNLNAFVSTPNVLNVNSVDIGSVQISNVVNIANLADASYHERYAQFGNWNKIFADGEKTYVYTNSWIDWKTVTRDQLLNSNNSTELTKRVVTESDVIYGANSWDPNMLPALNKGDIVTYNGNAYVITQSGSDYQYPIQSWYIGGQALQIN